MPKIEVLGRHWEAAHTFLGKGESEDHQLRVATLAHLFAEADDNGYQRGYRQATGQVRLRREHEAHAAARLKDASAQDWRRLREERVRILETIEHTLETTLQLHRTEGDGDE